MFETKNSVFLSVFLILFFLLIRWIRKKKQSQQDLDNTDVAKIASGLIGLIQSISLIHKSLSTEEIIKLLGLDVVTVFVGAFSLIIISLKGTELGDDLKFLLRIKHSKNQQTTSQQQPSQKQASP